MPSKDSKYHDDKVFFRNYESMLHLPFVMYADFESILVKQENNDGLNISSIMSFLKKRRLETSTKSRFQYLISISFKEMSSTMQLSAIFAEGHLLLIKAAKTFVTKRRYSIIAMSPEFIVELLIPYAT